MVVRRESRRWLSRHSLTKPLPSSSAGLGVPDLGVPLPKLANARKAASSSSSHPTSHAPCHHRNGITMCGQVAMMQVKMEERHARRSHKQLAILECVALCW